MLLKSLYFIYFMHGTNITIVFDNKIFKRLAENYLLLDIIYTHLPT